MHLDLLRSFLAVVAEGSFNRAALRLGTSQPTLTRQMRALEQVAGGRLVDRGPTGVKLTDAGHLLAERAPRVLEAADRALSETRRLAQGQRHELRIGYLLSAAQAYMDPALLTLRKSHPEVAVQLRELSPGEQISELRKGTLDVALVGQEGMVLRADFYTRCLASYPAVAVLPADHPRAGETSLSLADLREERFISCPDDQMPGRDEWVTSQCRKAGFRPRFGPKSDSLAHSFSLIVSSGAVALIPGYLQGIPHPGVRFVTLADAKPSWNLLVVWHRGKTSAALKAFLRALCENPGQSCQVQSCGAEARKPEAKARRSR